MNKYNAGDYICFKQNQTLISGRIEKVKLDSEFCAYDIWEKYNPIMHTNIREDAILLTLGDVVVDKTWSIRCDCTMTSCVVGDRTYYKLVKTEDFPTLTQPPPYTGSAAKSIWDKGELFSPKQWITALLIEEGVVSAFTRKQEDVDVIMKKIQQVSNADVSTKRFSVNLDYETENFIIRKCKEYKILPDDFMMALLLGYD